MSVSDYEVLFETGHKKERTKAKQKEGMPIMSGGSACFTQAEPAIYAELT